MKTALAIIVSLSLNALLGVMLLRGWSHSHAEHPTDLAEAAPSISETDQHRTVEEKPPEPPTMAPPRPFDWAQLHTESWATYRDDLRSIGCPNATIRNILRPLIRRHFAEQRRKLYTPWILHFWELGCPPRSDLIQLQAVNNEISRQERDALKELIKGGNGTALSNALNPELDSQLAFLSEDKRGQVRDILKQIEIDRFNQRRLAIRNGVSASEKQSTLADDLESRKESQLALILSPDELEQLKLRQSDYASLRELDSVELSDEEVVAIIRLREKAGTNPAQDGSAPTEEVQQIEKLLGPERAQQLKLAEDPDYQRAREAAAYLGDPDQKAIQLLAIQSQFADMAERLAASPDGGTPPTPEALNSAKEAIRKSLLDQVTQLTGDPRAAALWEYLNKDWLDEHFKAPDEPDPWEDPPDPKP